MACDNFTWSPTGTNFPYLPPERISLGPCGQSVETAGVPKAMASAKTLPNPSQAEERTNKLACRKYEYELLEKPGNLKSASIPNSLAKLSNNSPCDPSPKMAKRICLSVLAKAKARSRVGKSFWSSSRPMPRITGTSFCLNHSCGGSCLDISKILGEM